MVHMFRIYDDALVVTLRHRAVAEGRRSSALLEDALRLYLSTVAEPDIRPAQAQRREGPPTENPKTRFGRFVSDENGAPLTTASNLSANLDGMPDGVQHLGAADQLREALDADPFEGVPEHDHGRPLTPRQRERLRIEHQQWRRTHPEGQSQK